MTCKDCDRRIVCRYYTQWATVEQDETNRCQYFKSSSPVKCKDCIYYEPKNSLGTQGVCQCGEKDMNYNGEFYPYQDDSCSYGKRRNDSWSKS